MNQKLMQAIMPFLVVGLTLASQTLQAEAVIIGSETPENFSLSFSPLDSYPSGNSPYANGPLTSLFEGQYWKVSAQSLSASTGPAIGRSDLFVQQVIPGENTSPSAGFSLSTRNTIPYTQQISYLANSSTQVFGSVTCPLKSANCVSYELQEVLDPNVPNIYAGLSYELRGFFQPSGSSQPVPETSTGVGALAALGLIVAFRVKKRYFTGSHPKNYLS